jgi:hypothetical protein
MNAPQCYVIRPLPVLFRYSERLAKCTVRYKCVAFSSVCRTVHLWIVKHGRPKSRRNQGRPLKRLPDVCDQDRSTSVPTPWRLVTWWWWWWWWWCTILWRRALYKLTVHPSLNSRYLPVCGTANIDSRSHEMRPLEPFLGQIIQSTSTLPKDVY